MAASVEPRPIKRILVANRGEIAARILATCRELELETFAVHTEHDVGHTYNAHHAIRLASPAAYTDVEELVRVARRHGVDAVHPGYGFLSESERLAARMADVGVLVVGPGSEILRRTGDKLQARRLAESCGVAVLPALTSPTARVEEIRGFVGRNGLPVMIKAVDGGGGRGIRLVRRMEELEGAVRRAVEESASRTVFCESAAVDGFRHVEVQILGDGRGRVWHAWERECSIQRRYQKVVELAPSRCRDRGAVREAVEAAVRMAKSINYLSLGTFEFLLNPQTKQLFFLEINPRLQVEHTITEQICAVDIVRAQLRLAQGLDPHLAHLSQDALTPPSQHAIQFRLTAEDPAKKYALSIGRLQSFHFPSGVGVRVDTALVHGAPAIVGSEFDSVLAKLIVTAQTWEDAVARARRALQDTRLTGVQTNLALLRAVAAHPDFLAGDCDTQWLEARHEELLALSHRFQDPPDPLHHLVPPPPPTAAAPGGGGGGAAVGGATFFRKDDAWTLSLLPQGSATPQQHHLQLTRVLKNDFPASFSAQVLHTRPDQRPAAYTLHLRATSSSAAAAASAHPMGDPRNRDHVVLPLSGKLVEVLVDVGDVVPRDAPICVVRQMKMEVEVRSPRRGRVAWVTEAEDGEDVAEGMLGAVVVAEDGDDDDDGGKGEGEGRAKL